MSDIKRFEFAGKRSTKANISGTFEIGDDSFEVVHQKGTRIAFLIADVNKAGDPMGTIVSVLNFMEVAMTPESSKLFRSVALGEGDYPGLELEEVVEVFRHVLSLAALDPTGASKGSSPRSKPAGRSSTATAR